MPERICVIGAGPSGLTAAKNLLDAGFDVTVFDRGHEVGGNWVFDADSGHSSVFETTHIISSRRYSEYLDFPLPEESPDYPGHALLAAYFRDYADHFGLRAHVRLGMLVTQCRPRGEGGWMVEVRPDAGGEPARHVFDRLVVCNGHHWKPRWPAWEGRFEGRLLHSHDFKRAADFAGERVLIVGGGNSACDCAVETGRVSARTDLSWRRGYWIVPKFLFGKPVDTLYNRVVERMPWVPLGLRFRVLERLLRLVNGPNSAYGLPEPDHRFGETHPTVNSELLYAIRHGEVHPRPDIARFEGRRVHFTDGESAEYESVIACTGFEIAHPFFERSFIDYSEGPVPLYRKMIHPERDDLVFIGLFQPLGCIWPLAELQAKLVARWWGGHWAPPGGRAAREAAIAAEQRSLAPRQLETPRHTITVDYAEFRRTLLRDLRRSGAAPEAA